MWDNPNDSNYGSDEVPHQYFRLSTRFRDESDSEKIWSARLPDPVATFGKRSHSFQIRMSQKLIDDGERLELVEADLLKPETWPSAVSGCTYVCHVASPFVFGVSKKDENQLIKPAVQGTMNVLKPAKADEVLLGTTFGPSFLLCPLSRCLLLFPRTLP